MPVYLDSADLSEVGQAVELGFVAGVTTNPSLVRRAAAANHSRGLGTREEVYAAILAATAEGGGLVFAQVRTGSQETMAGEAAALRRLGPRLGVKIPCTVEGLKLTRKLSEEKVPTLVTAVYTPAQAYLAAEMGATFIAPYVNRWAEANGRPGAEFVAELSRTLAAVGGRTGILAASLKTVPAAVEALLAGAAAVTVPLPVLRDFPLHPLTEQALAKFDLDYDAPSE